MRPTSTPLLTASQHLGKLSLARDKLVSSGRSELAADVEREVANIRTQAETTRRPAIAGRDRQQRVEHR